MNRIQELSIIRLRDIKEYNKVVTLHSSKGVFMIIRRECKSKSNSFCNLYRPCTIDEVIGQEVNKNTIRNSLDNNTLLHTVLFTGRAGVGKTTIARIVALGLNCEVSSGPTSTPCLECPSCLSILNGNNMDVMEINVGKEGGKADVDNVTSKLDFAPMMSRYKVLIFDEAHKLTDAAKDLLLKPTEDGFPYVYFIFCTNQPEKLLKSEKKGGTPFLDRCSVMQFTTVSNKELEELLINICVFEGVSYKEDIINYIVEESRGTPRKAVMWLEQVCIEGSWTMLAASTITGGILEDNVDIFNICKKLNGGEFKAAVKEYDRIKESTEAEGVRIMMTLFFTACLKNAATEREGAKYDKILDIVNVPIYVTGKPGDALLVHYMYKVTHVIKESKKERN